jgi:protoheme IX farnesyltransferase
MLPAVDRVGSLTARLAFLYTLALLPITAALAVSGVSGGAFLIASQVLGVGFAVLGWSFVRQRGNAAARRLFLASIVYLPLLLGLMVADMDDRISHVGRTEAGGGISSAAHDLEALPAPGFEL